MRKDHEQGRTIITEFLKTISFLKSTSSITSPMITTSSANPMTSPTIQTTTTTLAEPNSSSPFLEKEKEMLQLKAKLLLKKIINPTTQTKKFVLFNIYDPFIARYYMTTQLMYYKLHKAP